MLQRTLLQCNWHMPPTPKFLGNFGQIERKHKKMSNGFIVPGSVASTNTTLEAHRAKKKEFVDLFTELFADLKEGDFFPGLAKTITVTQQSHPQDFQLQPVAGIQMEAVLSAPKLQPNLDLIVYRTTFDREVAFGLWNGQYVEKATCIIVRPLRFAEMTLPDDIHADASLCEQAYQGVQSIADPLIRLVASR